MVAGGIADEAMKAALELTEYGIECRVLSLCTIKPIDIQAIIDACNETYGIITIEEHNLSGGVGSAVAEVCMDLGLKPTKFTRIGMRDTYSSVVGDQLFLRSFYQLDSAQIVSSVRKLMSSKNDRRK